MESRKRPTGSAAVAGGCERRGNGPVQTLANQAPAHGRAPGPLDRDRELTNEAVVQVRPSARPRPDTGRAENQAQVRPVGGERAEGANLGRNVIASIDALVEQGVVDELHLGEDEARAKSEHA